MNLKNGNDSGNRGNRRAGGRMRKNDIRVYVHLGYGFDAEAWKERYRRGETSDFTPYGFHLAERPGVAVRFSSDARGGPRNRLIHAANNRLGFHIDHAWNNRRAIADSDVVWTMSENEAFSVAALMMLGVVPRRPIIGAAIWLFNTWDQIPRARQVLFRYLSSRIDVLTVHSAACLDVAECAALRTSVELSPFGVNAEVYAPLPERLLSPDGPIRVLAAGNDRTRDWGTLLEAFGNDPRFVVSAWTSALGLADTDRIGNLRLPKPPTNDAMLAMFADADVVVVPMFPNLFSGITVALEAAALGRPVISSATGGVPTYFSGEEVLYVPAGDPAALRQAALEARTPRLAAMAARAQARFAKDGYTTRAVIDRYLALTARVLSR